MYKQQVWYIVANEQNTDIFVKHKRKSIYFLSYKNFGFDYNIICFVVSFIYCLLQ